MQKINYDVLIVGTGPGGAATLYRLCELWKNHGAKKIGILEKGDKLIHSHSLNLPTMNVNRVRDEYFLANSTLVGERFPQFSGARMTYALGGRSLFWNGVAPRPIRTEWKKWSIHPLELTVYFEMAERLLHVTKSFAEGSSLQNILLKKLHAQGVLEATELPLAFDMAPSRQGEVHSNPWFSAINPLSNAMYLRPYDLGLNANVARVFTKTGKVEGVEVFSQDKKVYTIRAKNIVLSASALETPRILLNSYINGPAIGRYLTGHRSMIVVGTVNRKQFSAKLGNLAILKAETDESPYQIQIMGPDQYFSFQQFEEEPVEESPGIAYAAFGRVEPREDNCVYLDPHEKDEFGIPLNQVQYTLSPKDHQVGQIIVAGVKKTIAAMGAVLEAATPLAFRPPGSDMHESSTCRMGDDPETSATNWHGQIHGVRGLFVADNSVLPTLAAAGPVLTNVALAIRLADHLVRQDG